MTHLLSLLRRFPCPTVPDDSDQVMSFYETSFKEIFLFQGTKKNEDDILFFVNPAVNSSERVAVRRVPDDASCELRNLHFVPDWKSSFYVTLLCKMDCYIEFTLITHSKHHQVYGKTRVYPSPMQIKIKDKDDDGKGLKCKPLCQFPNICFDLKDLPEVPKIIVKGGEALKISLNVEGLDAFSIVLDYHSLSKTFGKAFSKRRHLTPDLDTEQDLCIELDNKGSAILSVLPVFLQDVRIGVKHAICSLFLKRPPFPLSRFIVKLSALQLNWLDVCRSLHSADRNHQSNLSTADKSTS